jgi:hypothetical protein
LPQKEAQRLFIQGIRRGMISENQIQTSQGRIF